MAFVHGLVRKWNYVFRTHSGISPLLFPLEKVIWARFIPSATGQDVPGNLLRDVLALPARLGVLGDCQHNGYI